MKLSKQLIQKKSKESNNKKTALNTAMITGMNILASKTRRIILMVIVVVFLLLSLIGAIGVINYIF